MTPATDLDVDVRPLREGDLSVADHIMRVAFGTFLGLAEPATFMGDAAFVRTRWRTDPSAAFAAECGGETVGSNFATQWGSVGFFGPLSVHPDLWDRGVGRRLMEPVMDCFARWQTTHAGLFTFAHSPKHVGLYQRFGFWPRFLTAVMSKPVGTPGHSPVYARFSDVPHDGRRTVLTECRDMTNAIFDGLDLTREICAVADQALGDTLLLWEGSTLAGIAICHSGSGTEAGSGTCFVKFGAVRPGPGAERYFQLLLQAAEHLAEARGSSRLIAGVNTSRHEAYRALLASGFRTDLQGIAMYRSNNDGYSRAGAFVIDDWR